MSIHTSTFGSMSDGQTATLYTLESEAGLTARITDYAATLVSLHVPGRDGTPADVVAGFDDLAGYESPANAKFGATVGPVANRIGGARFTLDGQSYELVANKQGNMLHSADRAFDSMRFAGELGETDEGPRVTFTATHPDGRAGLPGNVEAAVTYTLTHDGTLRIHYRATTDKPTPINLTNHSYFNLAGQDAGTVAQHVLTLYASRFTPRDETSVPTGEIAPVAGTPRDFTEPKLIGDGLEALKQAGDTFGFDDNYLIDASDQTLAPMADVREPASGRAMHLRGTQPALQFYTGGGLKGQAGKGGVSYRPGTLFCLETQHPPDAINKPNFPSPVVRPGETYDHTAEFQFRTV